MLIESNQVSLSQYESGTGASVVRCALGWLAHKFMGDAPAAKLNDEVLQVCHPATAGRFLAARTLFAKFIGLKTTDSAAVREWARCEGKETVAEKLTQFFGLTAKLAA